MDLRAFADGESMTAIAPEALAGYYRLIDGRDDGSPRRCRQRHRGGGGLELLLGCDLIVALAPRPSSAYPEVRRGLFPGGGGTAIGRRIPLAVALEMTMTGHYRFRPERAYEVGLVNTVVPPDEVVRRRWARPADRRQRAARGRGLPGAGSARHRRPIGVGSRRDHWRAVVFGSDDAREGATAYVERRDPVGAGE